MKYASTIAAAILASAALWIASPALGQTEGINLSWTDCGSAGVSNMTFACDVNTGAPFTMIGSFVPPSGINQFVGVECVVDMQTETDPVGDWWLTQAGAPCRAGAAVASFSFISGPFTCADPYGGGAFGGMQFTPSPNNTSAQAPLTNKGRFVLGAAISPSAPLTGGTEYYAFQILVLRTNTLTCSGGCAESACIRLNSINVVQPAGVGNSFLVSPPAGGSQEITWQGGAASCVAVPVQSRTWGEVKHLYR